MERSILPRIAPLILLFLAAAAIAAYALFGGGSDEAAYFLDVGQGDAQLVRHGGAAFLIDAGKGEAILDGLAGTLPPLSRRIDVLFISHGQEDHIGGIFALLDRYSIGAVAYNGEMTPLMSQLGRALKERGIPLIALARGDSVTLGDARFLVEWPPAQAKDGAGDSSTNERSMVVKFAKGNFAALFTGDIDEAAERLLAATGGIAADVLKVAHHGSRFSSSQAFLDAVRPSIAVIEVGKNSYGHPTQDALDRLAREGARIFRTDRDGTVRIMFGGGMLRAQILDAARAR
jgi:competence protein ComEC